MHLLLAFRAFFAALFGRTLPAEVVPAALLPVSVPAAPSPPIETKPEAKPTPPVEAKPEPKPAPAGPSPEAVAVRTLALFQAEGRLLDFLSEDIAGYADADVGAAVREIHRGCKKALKDHFDVEPVRSEDEDSSVEVPAGFNPATLRLVGNVVGQPPFRGTLKHKGWRAKAVRLPQVQSGEAAMVIAAAEIEI